MQLTPDDIILVTGATGLVGSHVAEQARGRGLRIRVLVRTGSSTALLKQWGCELVEGDLDQPDQLREACRGE